MGPSEQDRQKLKLFLQDRKSMQTSIDAAARVAKSRLRWVGDLPPD